MQGEDAPTNGGSSRVSGYELLKAMTEMEARLVAASVEMSRDTERHLNALRADVRSLEQTLNGRGGHAERLDQLDGPDGMVSKLRGRFVYALTIIGSAVGAVAYLALNGGPK